MEDRDIIKLYQARNESAIDITKEKYGKRLYSLSFGILKSKESAEECENDTYLKAWNTIPPKDPADCFYAFLARITRNLSISRARSEKALKRSAYICELSDEMENCIPDPNDNECILDEKIFAEALNAFLTALKPEKRMIFVRRYFFLDSVGDISKRYSISEAKVKTTLFRIRNDLRNYLEKEGYTL